MFLRLLIESFVRQRRRKLLAGIAILLGTTAVTAMLALATTIGDRIHSELAVYGANIIVTPKADKLEVKVGGVDVKPATGGAYLHEADLAKLKTIFWANNITGLSPELSYGVLVSGSKKTAKTELIGAWFKQPFGSIKSTGVPALHPLWRITGSWPQDGASSMFDHGLSQEAPGPVVLGRRLAEQLNLHVGDALHLEQATPQEHGSFISGFPFRVVGIVDGDDADTKLFVPLDIAETVFANSNSQAVVNSVSKDFDAVSRVEISARTKPEDAFAREDPDTLSPQKHEIWYCSPYANSIAYQIREAIPGSDAQQVRRVEQTEGTVLKRISGLMWLVSLAALLAAGFAVSAAMATAVLERRREIGLMRSLGASKTAIAGLFYAEAALLAVAAGTLGYVAGSALAWGLGARIFPGDAAGAVFLPVLLPVVLTMALVVAVAGSTPSIRTALRTDPATTLRGDA